MLLDSAQSARFGFCFKLNPAILKYELACRAARQDNLFRRGSKKNKCECKCKYRRNVLKCVCVCVRTASMLQLGVSFSSSSCCFFRLQVKMGPLELYRVPCSVYRVKSTGSWGLKESCRTFAQSESERVRGGGGGGEYNHARIESDVSQFSSVLARHLNYLRLCQHLEFHKFWPVDAWQIASGRLHTRST